MKKTSKINTIPNKVGTYLLIALTTGTMKVHGQVEEFGLLRDVSESSIEAKEFDTNDTFRKVVTKLELKDSSKGVNLRTALCGESRIPEVRLASLPKGDPWFPSTSVRKKQLGQFLAKGKSDMDYIGNHPCDQSQTNLYRAIVQMVKQFDADATTKTLVIFSDMVEVSSVFNATKYTRNPSGLIRDYDSILEIFERDAPLPDLSGVTVILITPGNTDLLLWMSRFWEKLLTSQGAQVQVRATY